MFILDSVIQNDEAEYNIERSRRSVAPNRRSEIRSMSPEDRPSCPPGQVINILRYKNHEKLSK